MVTKQDTRVLSHAITNKDHEGQAVHTKLPAVETNMAAAPRAAQWLTAADRTRHSLIGHCYYSSTHTMSAIWHVQAS